MSGKNFSGGTGCAGVMSGVHVQIRMQDYNSLSVEVVIWTTHTHTHRQTQTDCSDRQTDNSWPVMLL